jgi:glutathione synthase/RimK-type ligase-like ATP-grasp enzyme/tetratricopeptide (TPR) repeat protein
MQDRNDLDIARALELHRTGRVSEAKAIYEAAIARDQNNANAIGLLGIVAIQEGDRAKAVSLWKKSLSGQSDFFIYIRNLNNLIVTLLEDSRDAEARTLLESTDLPAWADPSPPDERELKSIVSLVMCLQRLDLNKKARALFEPVAALIAADPEATRLLASVRFEDNDFGPALEILKTFRDSDDLWTLTTRLRCDGELGLRAEAAIDYEKLLQMASVYVSKDIRKDLPTILVINPGEQIPVTGSLLDLHFTGNFPTQLTGAMGDAFNFVSVLGNSKYAKGKELKPDIVLNNIVSGELLSRGNGLKEDVSALADSFKAPVINHPSQAALTTRQRVAFALKDLPAVIVPKTMRFEADTNSLMIQIASLEEKLRYPLIVRSPFFHRGAGMVRIGNRAELARELEARNKQQIYVQEFTENRAEDGLYRKIRATFIGDVVIPTRVDFSADWNVRGRRVPERKSFYRQRPHLIAAEKRILDAPSDVLTKEVMDTLREIRRKIPLDIFGIDFEVLPDGKILFFEANASMNLLSLPSPEDEDIRHPANAENLMKRTMAEYIMRRIAAGSADRLH